MLVAKQFKWEAAHRLPWHDGICRNLHGHSYRMFVEVSGPLDDRGMLVDFHEIKGWVTPLIQAWDHSTLVGEDDTELVDVLRSKGWKHAVVPYDTTAENLCRYVADYVVGHHSARIKGLGITRIRVRIAETETCYAEAEITV